MQTADGTELDRALALIGDDTSSEQVPWIVAEVSPQPDFEFLVTFVDGVHGTVRMREQIFGNDAGVFARLRDADMFATVRVEDGDVVWPNGLDLAPDAMYDEIKQHGEWVLR